MFIEATVVAKVQSAPGGDMQHILHLSCRVGWGDVFTSGEEDSFPIAVKVLPHVFDHYSVGDSFRLAHEGGIG